MPTPELNSRFDFRWKTTAISARRVRWDLHKPVLFAVKELRKLLKKPLPNRLRPETVILQTEFAHPTSPSRSYVVGMSVMLTVSVTSRRRLRVEARRCGRLPCMEGLPHSCTRLLGYNARTSDVVLVANLFSAVTDVLMSMFLILDYDHRAEQLMAQYELLENAFPAAADSVAEEGCEKQFVRMTPEDFAYWTRWVVQRAIHGLGEFQPKHQSRILARRKPKPQEIAHEQST